MKNAPNYTANKSQKLTLSKWSKCCLNLLEIEAKTSVQYNQAPLDKDIEKKNILMRKKSLLVRSRKILEKLRVEISIPTYIDTVLNHIEVDLEKIANNREELSRKRGRIPMPEKLHLYILYGCRSEFNAKKLSDFFSNQYNKRVDSIARGRNLNFLKVHLASDNSSIKESRNKQKRQIKQIRDTYERALKKQYPSKEKLEEQMKKVASETLQLLTINQVDMRLKISQSKAHQDRIRSRPFTGEWKVERKLS